MKTLFTIFVILVLTGVIYPQLTRDDIREILVLQGQTETVNESADSLYQRYISKTSYQTYDALSGFGQSIISGICEGAHQSKTAGYSNTGWMPKFLQDWYGTTVKTDNVMGKSLTWQKIWREADYITDRNGYSDLNRFYGDNWYLTLVSHLVVKNSMALLVRSSMK